MQNVQGRIFRDVGDPSDMRFFTHEECVELIRRADELKLEGIWAQYFDRQTLYSIDKLFNGPVN